MFGTFVGELNIPMYSFSDRVYEYLKTFNSLLRRIGKRFFSAHRVYYCYYYYYYLARSAKVAERAICFTDRNFFLSFF